LERFSDTLNDLDGELLKLKGTSQAYKKLAELSDSYQLIINNFKQNSSSFDELAKKQIAKHEEIKKTLNAIINENKSNVLQLKKILDGITNENKNNFQQLKRLNNEIGKKLNDSLEGLRKENRQFYLDFEKVVRIKLDENKSEIKQLIENERLQIKEIFENKLDKQTTEVKQITKKTNNLILVFGIISSLFLIGILVKLFL
jgi:hypothetical protein